MFYECDFVDYTETIVTELRPLVATLCQALLLLTSSIR